MKMIPVLDIKEGKAVHAVRGERASYRPLRSVFGDDGDPRTVARSIRGRLPIDEFYVADLDAIAGRPRVLSLYRELAESGAGLMLDSGIRRVGDAVVVSDSGASRIIVGLETLESRSSLEEIVRRLGSDRVVFSLDLKHGRPLLPATARWESDDPLEIARRAIGEGVRSLILLDLARVGAGSGTGTSALAINLRAFDPTVEILVGGGISRVAEIKLAALEGANGVLLGTAIHDGRIGPAEIREIAHWAV